MKEEDIIKLTKQLKIDIDKKIAENKDRFQRDSIDYIFKDGKISRQKYQSYIYGFNLINFNTMYYENIVNIFITFFINNSSASFIRESVAISSDKYAMYLNTTWNGILSLYNYDKIRLTIKIKNRWHRIYITKDNIEIKKGKK